MKFVSGYVRELKRYTKEYLAALFELADDKVDAFIKNLKAAGIIYSVPKSTEQFELSDLMDEDIIVSNNTDDDCLFVFKYVGIITVGNAVIKCYPKYLTSYAEHDIATGKVPISELKQVLKVLSRFAAKEQIINMYNGDDQKASFNTLAVILYLLNDYFEYGVYVNDEEIIELNGEGAILWEKTISDGFALIKNDAPYYVDLYTRRIVDNENDYIQRLHKYVLTQCFRHLDDAGLVELFDLSEVNISDEKLSDFGETDYILYQLQAELNVQFNTRKQSLLKTLYAYIAQEKTLENNYCLSLFGTSSFHVVWEKVCAQVLDNQYERLKNEIDAPQWYGYDDANSKYFKAGNKVDTLIPDIIVLDCNTERKHFAILDAKYYCIQLQKGRQPINYPGIGDVTKQYLYELAYKKYIKANNFDKVSNCFLMPTQGTETIVYGAVSMDMLTELKLQPIQVRLLPAETIYRCYLDYESFLFEKLKLDDECYESLQSV